MYNEGVFSVTALILSAVCMFGFAYRARVAFAITFFGHQLLNRKRYQTLYDLAYVDPRQLTILREELSAPIREQHFYRALTKYEASAYTEFRLFYAVHLRAMVKVLLITLVILAIVTQLQIVAILFGMICGVTALLVYEGTRVRLPQSIITAVILGYQYHNAYAAAYPKQYARHVARLANKTAPATG